MMTKDRRALAAALTVLLAAGCGRISHPVPAPERETTAAAPASFYEFSSARMDPSARQDATVFEYH
jgi:hypothetical protein